VRLPSRPHNIRRGVGGPRPVRACCACVPSLSGFPSLPVPTGTRSRCPGPFLLPNLLAQMGSMSLLVSSMWSMASRHKQRSAMLQDALRYRGASADGNLRARVDAYFDYMATYQHPGRCTGDPRAEIRARAAACRSLGDEQGECTAIHPRAIGTPGGCTWVQTR
jgi:hypothetical protein